MRQVKTKRGASFDPNQNISGAPAKKKRKKGTTSQGPAINVTVCHLQNVSLFIPKGRVRSNLRQKGQIQTIQLTTQIKPEEVKRSNNRVASQISGNWDYLETGQDNPTRGD